MTYAYRHNSPLAIKIDAIMKVRRIQAEELRAAIQAQLDAMREEAEKRKAEQRKNEKAEYEGNRRRSFRIFLAACEHFGISPAVMRSSTRKYNITQARQIAMYAIYKECWPIESLPRIGHWFHKDHTTVLHAVKKIEALCAAGDPKAVEAANFLRGVK